MTVTVTYRGSRSSLLAKLEALPAVLAGHLPDPTGAVQQLSLALGVQTLGLIREAFLIKARGGTDAAGIKWQGLSPKTIAYGRRHPGLTKGRKRNPGRPTLSKAQDDRWRAIFGQTYRAMVAKGKSDHEAKAIAGGHAWNVLKANGAQTVLEKYGSTPVEMLRNTGRLLNSFSPAVASGDQICRVQPGGCIVGSNVQYAAAHHYGNPARNLPARPLWPERAPQVWEERLGETLADGVRLLIPRLLGA